MKKNSYYVIPKIDEKIERIELRKLEIDNELMELNKELLKLYRFKSKRESIESVSVNINYLCSELESAMKSRVDKIKIRPLYGFFRGKTKKEIDESCRSMNVFGSDFYVLFENGKEISYNGIHLFDNFDEVQSDGRTLLEHCKIINPDDGFCSHSIEVDGSIKDIICSFNLEELSQGEKNNDECSVLELGVYRLLQKGNVIRVLNKGYQKRK